MITDNVPALIVHVGPDLRYRFVNRVHGEFFGRELEALVGFCSCATYCPPSTMNSSCR